MKTRCLRNADGEEVCKADYMKDKEGNAVVIQLDTPEKHRGQGHARNLLQKIGTENTNKELRVVANDHAAPYYRDKLKYKEIAPYVFSKNFHHDD